jgi:diguanylate cyclase (GGDEF)-like protein
MDMKILIADDDTSFHEMIKRALAPHSYQFTSAFDGADAVRLALIEKPDLILLDVDMPKKNGREVLRDLRSNIQTRTIPVIMLTVRSSLADRVDGLDLGADDYLGKPFQVEELRARVASSFRRSQRDLSANPLTRLPGGPAIEEDVNRRIRGQLPFGFFYVDIDHFKAFNDAYGYTEGDRVIMETAGFLSEVLKERGSAQDFLGHIGGDDFALITEPQLAEAIAAEIVEKFDSKAPGYYTSEDRKRGKIKTQDRLGHDQWFPLISLSIAIATTERRILNHYAKVVEITSEIKRYLKSSPNRKGSIYLKDRWTDKSPFLP